ncbi:MAG TPA: sugar transferase [Terriglobales bacterium]|nr:sugar transferase [Terriglobales bacterium]
MVSTIQAGNGFPSAWSKSKRKRVFDVACAFVLVISTAPVMVIVAVLVWATSSGPVLFRQTRLGLNGREFVLLKFRTMHHASSGPAVTQAGDPRVTFLGRVLRAYKLDELPQLFNVLRGDMTMVGPRPDLPQYWAQADNSSCAVLRLRPGITGAASLHFRNEEALLATIPADCIASYYISVQLPRKAAIDLDYASRASFWSDCTILFKTALPFLCGHEHRSQVLATNASARSKTDWSETRNL